MPKIGKCHINIIDPAKYQSDFGPPSRIKDGIEVKTSFACTRPAFICFTLIRLGKL